MATASAPETIGRYQILSVLGKGAMGIVYKAQDPTIGRVVALKTMRVDVHGIEEQEVLGRFRNEARAAGVLNHPNIVTVYDAGEEAGHFYMALEIIEGETVQQMMARMRVLPVDLVIDMTRQVCAGLDYAHDHGIIHRDVKPANIMIMANGVAKIMDFGIAKGVGAGLTSTGQVMGTPNYMSPEQVKGKPLDGRSDLFSLGVILYETLTGEKPFAGDNVTTIIYKIINEAPVAPRELDVTIHPGLDAIITKALAKNADDRFQRGADLAKALQAYKEVVAKEASARIGGAAHVPVTPVGGTPIAGIAAGAAAASAVGAAVVVKTPTPTATPAATPTPTSTAMPTPPPTPQSMPAAAARASAAAPSKPVTAAARPHQSHKSLVIALLAMLAVIVALGSAVVIRQRREEAKRLAAQQQAAASETGGTNAPATTSTDQLPAASTEAMPATTPAAAEPAAEDTTKRIAEKKPKTATPVAATAPAAQPAANAQLTVASTPAGAKVQVDGHSEAGWVTPVTVSGLKAGPHTVILSKDGYLAESRAIDLSSGRGNVSVSLNVAGGVLALGSTPAGAKIVVDSKDTGKVTPAQIKVPKGDHSITLRLDGYKDANATTSLHSGDTFNFAPQLQKSENAGQVITSPFKKLFGGGIPEGKGQVEVKSKPKGATILVNGQTFEKTTPAKIDLDPGTYTIKLQHDGYKTFTTQVTVEKGKSTKIEPSLQKQ